MIRVDNLDNLFWDNGSWQYPNTYPHLIGGKWLEKVTPVMTSPTTGWVILEGEYNYCQYNDELFFLKKDKRISVAKNKWRYVLIKDHLCTIFKNKANVIAKGTLVNTNLEILQDDEFQYTFPVFTNFNKKILLPLSEEKYNWKKHLIPTKPNKTFESWDTVGNKEFTQFITTLIQNRDQLGQEKKLSELLRGNKYCVLLGRANKSKREKNWKNELVEKINSFLDEIRSNEEIVFGNIDDRAHSWTELKGKYAITYKNYSLVSQIETNKQITEVDLSGLIDIKLISLSTAREEPNRVYFPIKLTYQDTLLEDDVDWSPETAKYIKKLSRRVRLPFCNPFTTRAIMYSNNKFSTWYWDKPNKELFYPQKVYYRIETPLAPLDKYSKDFPTQRKNESFRSIYLYYCYNLDFVFLFSNSLRNKNARLEGDYVLEKDFISPSTYFKNQDDIRVALSTNLTYSDDWNAVQVVEKDSYEEYYPWGAGGTLNTKEHLNIGWLIGQFSQHIKGNSAYFEDDYPFIIKAGTNTLKRIEGLTPVVATFIQNEDAYQKPTQDSVLGTYDSNHIWTLDIFNSLPLRARKNTLEADFLIGEKLLFTTWGMAPYLLFQPATLWGEYAYYWFSNLDTSPSKLIGNWLYWGSTTKGWYPYQIFDNGDGYILEKAKSWFKKAYEAYQKLEYKKFYENLDSFKQLKTHIQSNTNTYFTVKDTSFKNTPIGDLAKGDIFFSNLEWFWFDQSEATSLLTQKKNDFLTHTEDKSVNLDNGDIVVYCTPKDDLLHLGKVSIWDSEFTLPDNQYILDGAQINNPSPNIYENHKMKVKYTKIKELANFDSFQTLIDGLKSKTEIFFSGIADFNFEDLNREVKGTYLFDLVGTGFYCLYHGLKDQVHLIFKEEEASKSVGEITTKLYSISADEEVTNLTKTQWVNQQIKLSMYGQKLDLPIKAFKKEIVANIKVNTAHIKGAIKEHTESHKVEVNHKLGSAYFRFDIPKLITTSQITNTDAFAFEDLNMRNKRALEDYLIHRRQFELDIEKMKLSHESQRLEHKWAVANNWTNTIVGGIGLGAGAVALATKATLATNPVGLGILGVGAVAYGISKLAGIGKQTANLAWHLQEKGRIMEEQIDLDIRTKVMQSYTLDLNFERQKEDHLFNLRRLFAQASFNSSSSRDRNKLLDEMEDKKPKGEIYLELWTTSIQQDEYVADYHNKHGVDCRVPKWMMSIKNGIKAGIYTMEDVQISNLNDRIDLLFLKGRLESGIKFIDWIEHEKVEELIPVDPRITKLQKALELAQKHQIQLEQDKLIQSEKIQELLGKATIEQDKLDKITSDLANKTQQLDVAIKDIASRDKHIENDAQRYHELSQSYSEQQKELREARQTQNLYRGQTTQLRKAIEETQHKLQESKSALEKKTSENATLTRQIDSQLENIQQLTRDAQNKQAEIERLKPLELELQKQTQEKERLQERERALSIENQEQKSKIQTLEQEVQSNKDKDQALQAVREILTSKEAEIEELKNRPNEFFSMGFFNDIFSSCCGEGRKMTLVIKVPETVKANDYEIAEWDVRFFCFIAKRKGNQRYRIWRYPSYETYLIATERGDDRIENVRGVLWRNYAQYYFTEPQTTWKHLEIDRKIIPSNNVDFGCASAHKSPVVFIREPYAVPYFRIWLKSLDGTTYVNIRIINATAYWNVGEGRFEGPDRATDKHKKITTWLEYIEILGLRKYVSELCKKENIKIKGFNTSQEENRKIETIIPINPEDY